MVCTVAVVDSLAGVNHHNPQNNQKGSIPDFRRGGEYPLLFLF
jgi:hypothetical protein